MALLTHARPSSAACLFVSLISMLQCFAPCLWGQAVHEAEAKATLLFHFTHFVVWPRSLPNTPVPFVIGILGEDAFGHILDETIQDEIVDGRKIVVERYASLAALKAPQILFISRSEERRLEEILTALKDRPILTVADIPQFAKRGGTINLVTERNKIRIIVNVSTSQARHLTFSSNLLRAAEVIQ